MNTTNKNDYKYGESKEATKSISALLSISKKSGIGIKVSTVKESGVYTVSKSGGTGAVIRFFLSGITPDKSGIYSAAKVAEKVAFYSKTNGRKNVSKELRAHLDREGIAKDYSNLSSVLGGKVLGFIGSGGIVGFKS